MPSIVQVWGLPVAMVAIATAASTWLNLVSKHVPEPYLDEFFHVPQAQKYCANDYTWDPKITTPPGLYITSSILKYVLGCDTATLRALNGGAVCLICFVSYHILQKIHTRSSKEESARVREASSDIGREALTSLLDAHSALNISLFPPLFFFSALYYTDVMSTLAVLACHYTFMQSRLAGPSISSEVKQIIMGIIALSFRQTNIFWVAAFPAALTVIDVLRNVEVPTVGTSNNFGDALYSAWTSGKVVDLPIAQAGPFEYLSLLCTAAVAALRSSSHVMRSLMPYISLTVLFAGFVIWNGGVVLGDKTAHIATLHLPQILYLWPYIVFFSLPLVMAAALSPAVRLFPAWMRNSSKRYLTSYLQVTRPSIMAAFLFITIGLIAVHYNTVVHPYTLADNRHYVFYVFRLLRRHRSFKYLAVFVYGACAWATVHTLGLHPGRDVQDNQNSGVPRPPIRLVSRPCNASFMVIWIFATALSVATAPLVEPRYFIVPWIFWRLHVPYIPAARPATTAAEHDTYDVRLVLETIWLLAINTVVGHIFLFHGFAWQSEPDKVQRFLW